jgi:hypothetical protein
VACGFLINLEIEGRKGPEPMENPKVVLVLAGPCNSTSAGTGTVMLAILAPLPSPQLGSKTVKLGGLGGHTCLC